MIWYIPALLTTLMVWIICVAIALPLFGIGLVILTVTLIFDPQRRILHQYSCLWASIYTWINPFWSIRIRGRHKIPNRTACMIVSNHQSLVDILVLYRLFRHFKWVAKAELFNVPVFGWHMSLNRYIRIKRNDRRSQFQMLKTAIATLQSGSSVMIFPEGTRTDDGQLKRFKEGAFAIAKKAPAPIVPIVIDGSYRAMPKQSLMMHRVRIQVDVLDPIPVEKVVEMDTNELSQTVHNMIRDKLQQ